MIYFSSISYAIFTKKQEIISVFKGFQIGISKIRYLSIKLNREHFKTNLRAQYRYEVNEILQLQLLEKS